MSSSVLERTLVFSHDEEEISSPTLLSGSVPAQQQQEAVNVLISGAANILIIDFTTGSVSPHVAGAATEPVRVTARAASLLFNFALLFFFYLNIPVIRGRSFET